MQQRPTNEISNRRVWGATLAYVFRRPAKDGKVRFTAMYKAENGQYRSAGTYDDEDRAQQVADESERHAHLRLAETSPAEKATITVEEFVPKFPA